MTKAFKCSCTNEWQDNKYGKMMRLMNSCPVPPGMTPKWRCTVCGAIIHGR